MSLEPVEAAGDLASGLLLARVAEPSAGEAAGDHEPRRCLNCGAPLGTRYCGECGQSAHVHATLSSIWHDLLHGLFHFEGKIWRTVPELLFRPGCVTRRYIAGERATFVSPLALFLFALFLLFAIFEGVGVPFRPQAVVMQNGRHLSATEVDRLFTESTVKAGRLRQQLGSLPRGSVAARSLQRELDDAQDQANALSIAERINKGVTTATLGTFRPVTGWASLDRRIRSATANPPLLAVKLQANAHKFAWALIPLSVPFLWMVFAWRREYRLYDHTVFIIYALAMVMLLVTAMALLAATGAPVGWALLLIPIHQFRQLRGAYRVTWLGALWRTVWLQVSAVLVLTLFAVALLASGLID